VTPLKDQMQLGTCLPHRSDAPIAVAEIGAVAQRAERLGFADLWVTENQLDHNYGLDALTILTHASALTSRIRLGVAVLVMGVHSPISVAHRVASLDYLSGGRVTLGIGIGRGNDYVDFQIPLQRRVRRFTESVALMQALWTQPDVTFEGEIFRLEGGLMAQKPVQKPYPPLWFGGSHPRALARAVAMADGWIGGGAQTTADFAQSVALLRSALDESGRDPATFAISKRVFVAIADRAGEARKAAQHWFDVVYRQPHLTDISGVYGTAEQVREQLAAIAATGATHLLLNPVSDYLAQVDALAEVTGLAPVTSRSS
jgi:probable F420-dependent oxidoreductase